MVVSPLSLAGHRYSASERQSRFCTGSPPHHCFSPEDIRDEGAQKCGQCRNDEGICHLLNLHDCGHTGLQSCEQWAQTQSVIHIAFKRSGSNFMFTFSRVFSRKLRATLGSRKERPKSEASPTEYPVVPVKYPSLQVG